MSLKKKLEGKMFEYVNNNVLPSAYEVLKRAREEKELPTYEEFLKRVKDKMLGEEVI